MQLRQKKDPPKQLDVDRYCNWIMVFNGVIESSFPYAEILTARSKTLSNAPTDHCPLVFDLPNKLGSHVSYAFINTDLSSFALLTLARKLVAAHNNFVTQEIAVSVTGFDAADTARVSEAIIAALLSASAELPNFKGKPSSLIKKPTRIQLYGIKKSDNFRRTFAEAEGNTLARSLSILPANKLTPGLYLRRLRKLAKENKWQLHFYDTKSLKQRKAGAFLAVSQGSPNADAGIVKLSYRPKKPGSGGQLALVGKGICYDTGGTNLKQANHMFGMHEDMQGSAVALGTFLALTRLEVDFPLQCWLALAMNHIGPNAYKPNDVVTACDGTTIEIVHTDAEGRMVLADTLVMASKEKPALIIDYATLTGSCVHSIGTAYSGVFTNREAWGSHLIKAGKTSGERVWPFPLDEDFDAMLKSDIADIKQCSLEAGVDHILAARFLQRFIKKDTPWVHLDLSSSYNKGGLAHISTDTTGFGVRFTLNLLLDQDLYGKLLVN